LWISICEKDERFCTSLSVKFSLEKIIYPICEGNQAKNKWQHMLKVSGSYDIWHHLQEELWKSQQVR
jgi:hypothetical protein